MSVASRIIAAVGPASAIRLPCEQISYGGTASTYLVFRIDSIPGDYADDCAQADRWLCQLHLYAPFTQNTRVLRRKIRNAISDAGFTYPNQIDASEMIRSADGTEQHIVFEFEDAGGFADD